MWERLVDGKCIFVDENGKLFEKKAMVADVQPHPPEVYADIIATDVTVTIINDVAMVAHNADEHETFYDRGFMQSPGRSLRGVDVEPAGDSLAE